MITFKQFINESRSAPLYHGTSMGLLYKMLDDGIQAKTQHNDFAVGRAPIKTTIYNGKRSAYPARDYKDTKKIPGVSLTRNFNFARKWAKANLGKISYTVVIELDQNALSQRYKIVPTNFYGWGSTIHGARAQGESNTTNEYEEFLITRSADEVIPWRYVKRIYTDDPHPSEELTSHCIVYGIDLVNKLQIKR